MSLKICWCQWDCGKISWASCGMWSSPEQINYAFPAHSFLAKNEGMPPSLCGKPHLLVIRWVSEIIKTKIQKKKNSLSIIVMVMSIRGCGQTPSYSTPQWLCCLGYLSGGLLLADDRAEELPVHVVMCAAVQWSEQSSLRAQPHTFSLRKEGHTPQQ